MSTVPSPLAQRGATAFYRKMARTFTWPLSRSSSVESVLLRRSAATGEVCFGRSDIDTSVVLSADTAESGARLSVLYRQVEILRRLNPAMSHFEVLPAGAISDVVQRDTFWGSLERRSARLMWGRPVSYPQVPVQARHAVNRLMLWIELFFAEAIQARNARNIKKISLECWNAWIVARHMVPEPFLLRSEMELHLRGVRPDIEPERLREPSYASAFVMGLAADLHRRYLPPLASLTTTTFFEATTAPVILPRLFVVLPSPDAPLPPEAFRPGAYICTPEVLHLSIHFKNAFLEWSIPEFVWRLGLTHAPRAEWIRTCYHYNQLRFLLFPGFLDTRVPRRTAWVDCLRHAITALTAGQTPNIYHHVDPVVAGTAPKSMEDYYRTRYEPLREQLCQFDVALTPLIGSVELSPRLEEL